MENDISTDAVGVLPRTSEDNIELHIQLSRTGEIDNKEHNNYLPPLNSNISCSTQHVNYIQTKTQDSESIDITSVRQKREEHVKDFSSDNIKIVLTKNECLDKSGNRELIGSPTEDQRQLQANCQEFSNTKITTQHKIPCLPANPPQDWRLNELLDYIASNVDETELKRIKLMFSGPEGIGKKVRQECHTCFDFFTVLKERGFLSRDNVLYLNKILYVLQRKDLLQKTVKYAVEEGDAIYYYTVEGQTDAGEKQIKVHVKADVQNYNRDELYQLRNLVARIVCIPAEEIFISAVEPGSSFIIIFTMAEMYVDILQSMLERKVNLRKLTAIGVDIIIIEGNRYDVSGQDAVIDVSEQCKELMNVYKQLENTRHDLEKMEIISLNCQNEFKKVSDRLQKAESTRNAVESLESRNTELTTLCLMLQSMHFTYGVKESSIERFQQLMAEASNKEQDKELIQRIIRANTEIVAACHRNRNELEHQEESIKMEKRKCIEFELRRDLVSGTMTAEEVLLEYYSQFLQYLNLKLNLDETKLLQKTSQALTSEQKTTLVNMFKWPKNDVIKACIDADEELLLLGVKCKEAMMENKQIETDDMLVRCGKAIGLDLISIFQNVREQIKKEKSEQDNITFNKKLIQLLEEHKKTAQEIITMFTEKVLSKVLPSESKLDYSVLRSVMQKCKGLHFFLDEIERNELLHMNDWQHDDVVRRCIHEDTDLLIFGLLIEYIERVNQWISPEIFLIKIQHKLNRSDLPSLFRRLKETEDEQQIQFKYFETKKTKESNLLKDLKSKRKSAEYILQQKLTNFTIKLVENIDIVNGPQFSNLTKLLRDISAEFTSAESDCLLQQYQWHDNDVIRECIRVDKTLLIQGLWQKEIEEMQEITKPGKFISDVCEEVDRVDIYNMFKENEILLPLNEKLFFHMMDKAFEYFESHLDLESCKHGEQTVLDEGICEK